MKPGQKKKIRLAFESLERQFTPERYAQTDPVRFLHVLRKQGAEPLDLEVAGLYASSLAYGGVQVIGKSLEKLFQTTGPRVAEFVKQFRPRRDRDCFKGFVHRFHKGRDLALFTWLLKQVLDSYGSLENTFLAGDQKEALDIEPGLEFLVQTILAGDVRPFHASGQLPPRAPVRHLLPAPSAGSACKRLCLYLRWMVRPEFPDLGLWKTLSPGRLVIPLDTHVTRFGRYLGLSQRKSANWKMAQEISLALRALRPKDPVGIDFALAHLGIHHCQHRWKAEVCSLCPLLESCSLAKGKKHPANEAS